MDDFFYDAARQHIDNQLTSSICENKGLILLTGERGVGRTIFLHHLAEDLEIVHGVVLFPPSRVISCEGSLTFGEIVRVCRSRSNGQYDGAGDEDDESGLAKLLEQCNKSDAPVALILDDADELQLQALEQLKALSALSADGRGRLSIVLSGRLDAPNEQSCPAFEAARLDPDVSLRLQRFQDRDVGPYICHRIRLAGRRGPEPFATSAIDRIIHYSGGNPWSINWICNSALVFASSRAIKTISAEIIDAVAAGGAPETIADSLSDWEKRTDHTSDHELPLVPKGNATVFQTDQSHPPVSVLEKDTSATEEDEGDKFHFDGEPFCDAGRAPEFAALAGTPNPRSTEEFAREEPVGWWSQDRIGIVLRSVWIFLVVTLVVGAGGVYLAQTGRFDAIAFSKRWLADISGNESTLPPNDTRGSGFVDVRPSHRVEPSSKVDREYSLDTNSPASSGKSRQIPAEQRQAIEKPLRVSGSPLEMGSEARSDETIGRTSVSVASRPIPALDAAIEKAGPDTGSKPVTETNDAVNRPPLAVTTISGVEIDETTKNIGTQVEIEAPMGPDADEAVGGRELLQELGSATEPGEAVERREVAGEPMPAEMGTAAETGILVDGGEVAVESGSPAEIDSPAAGEAAPAEMETAAGTGILVDGGEVAVESGSPAEIDPPAAGEAAPAEMETAAAIKETVENRVVAAEAEADTGSVKVMEALAFPVETRTEGGSEEADARFHLPAKTEPHPGTDTTVETSDVPADTIAIEKGSHGRSTDSVAEARASDQPPTDAGPAASGPLPAGENIQREVKSPDYEAPSELRQVRRGSVAVQGTSDAREVSVPVTARVDLPKLGDLPQGRPEPQPSEPEALAPGEPPTPLHVAEPTQPQFEVERLLDRGNQLLALGDVASARLFYRLAAKNGSARGATAMGSTYDPVYLEQIGFVGAKPSPAEAIKWYRQAIDMGHREAEAQLRELTNRLERAASSGDGEAQRILENVRN